MMLTDTRAQVLQAVDIVELISQTVALKRRGRSFVGLCPFHQEKTPSFHVNPSRQSFYCFGCKAGGTAFDFVMKRDRIEFREALELLARQAGVELPQFGGQKSKPGERQALLDAQSAACRFFQDLLNEPEQGKAAREYLQKRGFTDESIKRFQIGLAADAWDGLLKGPVGKKFPPPVLLSAGLVKQREGGNGFYDTFRNRIMFPIRNESGQIIAFGGRVMPGSQDPAKYLNSPETMLFNKSRAIFGIDLARQKIVETRSAVVVEGYVDAAMSHQFGATNVVSVLGTAMTEQHVAVLRRFADRIVLLFDADSAGDAAVDRVVQLFLTQPVEIAVASLSEGLDPDEWLLKYGVEAFDKLLAGATDALSYAWKQLGRRFASSSGVTDQQKAAAEFMDLLSRAATGGGPVDSIRLGSILARVSRLTEIPLEQLHERCRPKRQHRPAGHAGGRMGESVPAAGMAGEVKDETGQVPNEASPGAGEVNETASSRDKAECWILGVLLVEPRRWQAAQSAVSPEDFEGPLRRRLAEIYWAYQRDEGEPVFSELLAALPDEALRVLAIQLAEEVEELENLDVSMQGAMELLASQRRNRESQQIVNTFVRSKDAGCTPDEQDELLRKLSQAKGKPDLRNIGPRLGK